MAHFVKSPGTTGSGYDADNKLAPGSLWRVRIPCGQTRTVALWGGDGLRVKSTNWKVVPADKLRESGRVSGMRLFEITGAVPGAGEIEVCGPGGAFWIRLLVHVEDRPVAPPAGVPRNVWLLRDSPKAVRDKNVFVGAARIVPVPINSRPAAPKFRGLAIHVTAGEGNADQVVANAWGKSGVAAHFIIERSGAIVQCMALTLTGEAQGGPGDPNPHWLSVEFVCSMNNQGTNGYLTRPQLVACNRLFVQLAKRFGFPTTLASPLITDHGEFGKVARDLAAAHGVVGSKTREEAMKSTGLSCHRWLGPGHACPGLLGLRMMPTILNPSAANTDIEM